MAINERRRMAVLEGLLVVRLERAVFTLICGYLGKYAEVHIWESTGNPVINTRLWVLTRVIRKRRIEAWDS